MKTRPIGVSILAVLAALAAVWAGYRVLQFLGLFPFWFGPVPFHSFSLFAALMWGLMVWVYVWLVKMLWDVAYADGQLDPYEEHTIRKLAERLHVPHREFIMTKHEASGEG